MDYHLLLNNRQIPIVSGTLSKTANDLDKYEFFVPTMLLYTQDLFMERAEIYLDYSLFAQIVIYDIGDRKKENNVDFIKISAYNILGRLMLDYYSKEDAYYKNVPLTIILQDLLSVTDDWSLGDFSTLLVDEALTVDLRAKDTLWGQIHEVITLLEKTYVQASVDDLGGYLLSVGAFDASQGLVSDYNIESPMKYKRSSKTPLKRLRGQGGKSGAAKLTLEDAARNFPELLEDAEYPILVDSNGSYYVMNMNVAKGGSIAKTFNIAKTKNGAEGTDAEDIAEAARTLYLLCKTELKLSEPDLQIDVKFSHSELPSVPSTWLVIGTTFDTYYDHTLFQRITSAIDNVYENLILVSYKFDFFEDVKKIVNDITGLQELRFSIDAHFSRIGIEEINDDTVELAKLMERTDTNDVETDQLNILGTATSILNHTGVAADCFTNGIAGKLFAFDVPTPPLGARLVYMTVVPNKDGCRIKKVSSPRLLPVSANGVVCVTDENSTDWDATSDITCTATFYYLI